MYIPPSIFNAYNICPRQAWLMSRNLTADQQNAYIDIGRLISKESFSREKKEIYLADQNAKIDMIIRDNRKLFIAEIKKSSYTLKSSILQLKYYLYILNNKGIKISGLLKIPKEKRSIKIILRDDDKSIIEEKIKEINTLLELECMPKANKVKICSKCGHGDFCWS